VIRSVAFAYGLTPVLESVSAEGSKLAVTGPNGSGKTTLLKLILGLLAPTAGTLAAPRRKTAVFQEDRLLEHLTAVGNVRALRPDKVPGDAIAEEFRAVGLPEEAWLRPVRELSGGQRRRVCLARALMPGQELVCLDEPFSGIDADSLPALRAHTRDRLDGVDAAISTHSAEDLHFFGWPRIHLG
jgi:NitT/TauT family transport system ATP-binding protein